MELFPGLRVAAVAGLGVDGRKFPHARQRNLSALEQLGTAETELDREHRADSGADGIEYLTGKAAAVFQASAVLIGSVVEIRGEELVDQPAVAAVDEDHVIATPISLSVSWTTKTLVIVHFCDCRETAKHAIKRSFS